MPGVVVTTQTRTGPTTPLRPASGQWFVAGITERGDTENPVLLRSLNDYTRLLGDRVTYGNLYDQMRVFFGEGGRQAWVVRLVGATASVGLKSLNDRAGTPLPTLRFDAATPGAWSANLSVEILNGSLANTFRVIIKLSGNTVEDQNNIATPAEAVTRFVTSTYVHAVNLASATAAPDNNPAVAADADFSAGNDQRGDVVADDYVAALDKFLPEMGDGAVSIPGMGNAVHTGIVAHCEATNRVALLASAQGAATSTLAADALAVNSQFAGLFAPWVVIPDGVGVTRSIDPTGFVAACRDRAHTTIGAWGVPAGKAGQSLVLVGLDQAFTTNEANNLDSQRVSVIRPIANTVRLYGWRSLSALEQDYYLLKERDLLNRLVVAANDILEDYVFAPVDTRGQLLSSINAALIGLVAPIADAGGLYERVDQLTGETVDPGYMCDTGPSVNTPTTLAQNELRAYLYVRPSPTASLINLTIVKAAVLNGF